MDSKVIAQELAYLLAEAIDDKKYWMLVAEHEMDLAPRRVPVHQIDEHVQYVVEDALKAFAADSGIRDLLHDAVMTALENWYEPHER